MQNSMASFTEVPCCWKCGQAGHWSYLNWGFPRVEDVNEQRDNSNTRRLQVC